MAYIEAERFAELKSRVKAECLRRCHTGSVAEYGGEKYEYTNSPTEDHTVDVEHYEKLALPLSKIHSEKVPSLDAGFEARRKVLEAENKHWRFVARLENGKASVGLQEVGVNHPFYGLEGSNNIILLTTERYKEYPMMIQGYGAGAGVTAAGVFADIMSIANV